MSRFPIRSWYLEGVEAAEIPTSVAELERRFPSRKVDPSLLVGAAKWDHLLRGTDHAIPAGWCTLAEVAKTRRGIATGSNAFFLISQQEAKRRGLAEGRLLPCVGRAKDVRGMIFHRKDYGGLRSEGAKVCLVNLAPPLNEAERAYVASGEEAGLRSRFLLAQRKPWYAIENRPPSPIWASVFGRGRLRFICNAAGAYSLTNFHCVYPTDSSAAWARALTLVLNLPEVDSLASQHIRRYGAGLKKFEPKDLLGIAIPDLRRSSSDTIEHLSRLLGRLDGAERDGAEGAAAAVYDEVRSALGLNQEKGAGPL